MMAANIEIKARLRDPEAVRARAEALSGLPVQIIPQEDTFFVVPRGRLKLRQLAPDWGQLVYYERPDQVGPKRSDYILAGTPEPAGLKAALAAALGVRGVVCKLRRLYQVGQTRIHLDEVEGLGDFLELEVVLSSGQTDAEGRAIAEELRLKLGIADADLLEGAYLDLIESGAGKQAGGAQDCADRACRR
jgi:predicted adenylyl cyclase CyaB